MKNNFAIIISNTSRSFSYLKALKKNKLYPNYIIHLDDGSKNSIYKKFNHNNYFSLGKNIRKIDGKEINKRVAKFILKNKTCNIVYSGYPGIIVKDEIILKKKKLIHSHPGKLPSFKGSTTIYYSLLKAKCIYCTTFILSKNLDQGKLLYIQKYKIPNSIKKIDNEFDDFIRTKNLIDVLKNNYRNNYETKSHKKTPYYVIHPVLRAIVMNKFK